MTRIILFNKPFGVLSQFTEAGAPGTGHRTLSEFVSVPGAYPAGRLDKDSEGLLVLTDDGALQNRIASPKFRTVKRYWAQVEGTPDGAALEALRRGVSLQDGPTAPAEVNRMEEPDGLWPRDPPIRVRKSVADTWIEIAIAEGRNRQVRRMTASVGHPTLRLIRHAIGDWTLDGLASGDWREAEAP